MMAIYYTQGNALMLNRTTKAVRHLDKWVPCCEGRLISHSDHPARLVRVVTEIESVQIADQYREALYVNKLSPNGFQFGDNYMLSQHPLSELKT